MANKMLVMLIKILGIVVFCLLTLWAFVATKNFCYDIFADQPYQVNKELAKEAEIEVKDGESVSGIAKELEKKDIIANSFKFTLALKYMDGTEDIKPGTYKVNSSMRPSEILSIISQKEEF